MIATKNLIKGELHLIHKQLHLPFVKFYHNATYQQKFMKRLSRSLESKYPNLHVEVDENDFEYILRIKEIKK